MPAPIAGLAHLSCDGRAIAALEVARTRAQRRRGLLGRDSVDGALWLTRTRWVHTFGMAFAIDVAHVAADGRVVRTATMSPGRLGRPVPGARSVVEAEAGAFTRWGVAAGHRLAIAPGGS